MKWRKSLACSSPLDQDSSARQELKGEVYNIFPFIRDPDPMNRTFPMNRAFTLLGIINAIFFPVRHYDELNRMVEIVRHEVTHYILGSTVVTCEERALGARLLGTVWNFLLDADDDVRLLIPSFTIVGPAGKNFGLQLLTERLEQLFEAYKAIHEIVACVIQQERENWDRDKVKQLIRQEVDGDLLDKKALDGFLEVYENFGPIGAYFVGHYALNKVGLTKRSALERFKRAIEQTCKYEVKVHGTGQIEIARMLKHAALLLHLDSNLPGFNMGRCPMAGACLPNALDSLAESLTVRSKENGNPGPSNGEQVAAMVYRRSSLRMKNIRCNREQQLAQGNRRLTSSVHEVLGWFDPEVRSSMGEIIGDDSQEPRGRFLIPLVLVEHENCDYKFTIGINREEKERPLIDISPGNFGVFILEAALQQMMCGEGPLCLCYPHQPANCVFKFLLRAMWDRTEPDPEWYNNWKLPNKKPRCIE